MIPEIAARVARLLPLPLKRRLHARQLVLSHKLAILHRYSVPVWSRAGVRHLLLDHECANFTYDIENVDELPRFVSSSVGCSVDEAGRYLREIVEDDVLRRELVERLLQRSDRNAEPRFGRRLGWYCVPTRRRRSFSSATMLT